MPKKYSSGRCHICHENKSYIRACDFCHHHICHADAHYIGVPSHHLNTVENRTLRVCENCLPSYYKGDAEHDFYVKL